MYVQMVGVKRSFGSEISPLWRLEAAAQFDTVGVAPGVVVGDRELDGSFAGIEVEALHAKSWLAGGAFDHFGHVGGDGFGCNVASRGSMAAITVAFGMFCEKTLFSASWAPSSGERYTRVSANGSPS